MVLPLILRGALTLVPKVTSKVAPIIGGVVKTIVKKPVKSLVSGTILTLGAPSLIGLLSVPKISKEIDPRKRFRAGQSFGQALTQPQLQSIPNDGGSVIKKGAAAFGVAGAIIGAAAIGKQVLPKIKGLKPSAKDKVLESSAIQKNVPIETPDIGKQVAVDPTLGATPKPKEPTKEKPLSIKNTFNPEINIKFSKSRKFINQQLLIRQ